MWPLQSILLAVLLAVVFAAGYCFCCYTTIFGKDGTWKDCSDCSVGLQPSSYTEVQPLNDDKAPSEAAPTVPTDPAPDQLASSYTEVPLNDDKAPPEATPMVPKEPTPDQFGRILRFHMRLLMVLPLLPLFAWSSTSCEAGAPWWVYGLYLPFLIFSKATEVWVLRQLQVNFWDFSVLLDLLIGTFEHMDFFTDGALPVQAAKCDPHVTEVWAESFEVSAWSWPAARLIRVLHFWGVLLMSFMAATLAQQMLGSRGNVDRPLAGTALSADAAAMTAVASHCVNVDRKKLGFALSYRSLYTCASKVVMENLTQLFLQASLYAILYDQLTAAGQWKLWSCMVFGLVAAAKKLCEVTVGICLQFKLKMAPVQDVRRLIVLSMVTWIPGFLILAWVVAKLWHVRDCHGHQSKSLSHSHLWNPSTGCVSQNSSFT